MPDHLGADQRKTKEDKDDDKPIQGTKLFNLLKEKYLNTVP
jgi:hypothetical protein